MYQEACDSTYHSELIPFGETVLLRIPRPHSTDESEQDDLQRPEGEQDEDSGERS